MARLLIALGILLILAGLTWLAFPKAVGWFGRLPGDIRIEREAFSLFVPVTSMLLLSLLLTGVANGLAWLCGFLGRR